MFNIAVDAHGRTYNAPELVENKSEADIGNARKRKYLCMTCVGEKHPVHLKVRRKSKGSCEKTRKYTATAWFSHHGGGNNGNSEKYPNESCSETAVHCHAKHILCANVARYWYETSKCIGCPRHTKIENGVGASARVEYTEKISGGTIYIFDAVLMRGDAHNSVVHSVLEVWATHETSDEKRKYCLEKGYTFAEFHAPHVVEMHEKTQKGGTYKLENLKIREFECQQCECVRKQNEIRLEKARLQKEAAAEQARVLKAAADEQARLTALLVQEQQQKREQVDRQFYETSTGAETRVIELQNDLHATCMYVAWMCANFTHNSAPSLYEMYGNPRTRSIIQGLYADIDMVYHGDAFRGFFDYAIEYRVRTLARKTRMLELYAESQRYQHRQQVLETQRIQAIQKRRMTRPDNIRDILKPKTQTSTLVHHFEKTTTRPQMTKSGHESSTSFLSGPLGLPYPGYKH